MNSLIWRQFDIHPSSCVCRADCYRPSVVNIDHSAHRVGRHQHKARFLAIVFEWAKMRQGQQKQRLAILAVNMPGLFAAFLASPLVLTRSAHDAAPSTQQRLPVSTHQFLDFCIDGNRNALLARRRRGSCGPCWPVAPKCIVYALLAILHVQHRYVGAGRYVRASCRLAVDGRVCPPDAVKVQPRIFVLINSSAHLFTVQHAPVRYTVWIYSIVANAWTALQINISGHRRPCSGRACRRGYFICGIVDGKSAAKKCLIRVDRRGYSYLSTRRLAQVSAITVARHSCCPIMLHRRRCVGRCLIPCLSGWMLTV